MPFNIEIISGPVPVKIQVVNKLLTIYFSDDSENRIQGALAREDWGRLSQFVHSFPETGHEDGVFLSEGVYHRKKQHTNGRESTLLHTHIEFLCEVTPEIFARYFNEFYFQQILRGNYYPFFKDREEVDYVINAFSEYYKEFKGSSLEAQYNSDTQLTPEELIEHKEYVRKKKQENTENFLPADSNPLLTALMKQSIFSSKTEPQPTVGLGARENLENIFKNALELELLKLLAREPINNGVNNNDNLDEVCPIM